MTPELEALDSRPHVIRIPHQIDVPVTSRILRLIDSTPFQRLRRISQLGLVGLVYPGARHSRFEHSLGVYRNVLLFVRQLRQFEVFRSAVDAAAIEALTVAGLLHDLGHWPYCHPIEDMRLAVFPRHEELAIQLLDEDPLADLLSRDWTLDRQRLKRLLSGQPLDSMECLLCSILSGPLDVDKLDYLYRDSLHCGVPYGMHFDAPRLIHALRLNDKGDGIGITMKGKTAAEMMVFARYIMFSEVYWHHAVRSATAMLQRLVYRWQAENSEACPPHWLTHLDDRSFVESLLQSILSPVGDPLFAGLFGAQRRLYKRLREYTAQHHRQIYDGWAQLPYDVLVERGAQLARDLAKTSGLRIADDDLLVDAPPVGWEIQFRVPVYENGQFCPLEAISPVVAALAGASFDSYVKRVRIFVKPELAEPLRDVEVEAFL